MVDEQAELISICESFAQESQRLRNRVVELALFAQDEVARRVDVEIALRAVEEYAEELRRQLALTEDALHALENSLSMRALAPFRSVYGKVRRR